MEGGARRVLRVWLEGGVRRVCWEGVVYMGVEGRARRVLRRVWYRLEGQKSLLGMEGWEEVVWGGCGGGGLFGRVVYT